MLKFLARKKFFSMLIAGLSVMGLWLALDVLPANADCYCVALKSTVGIKTGFKVGALTDGCQTTCLSVTSCGTICNMTAVSGGSCEFVATSRLCPAIEKDLGCCECADGSKDTNIGSDKACGIACATKKGKKTWNEGACKTAASASGNSSGPPPKKYYALYNAVGTTSIPELMGRFINVFLGIVGAIALAAFVYGGVMWMTARGNTKQADSARGALVNAAIGLFIIAFAYTLSSNFITMLTTVQVPPPERLPSEQQTVAEIEQAGEQQSVQQQKAEEQQAQQSGSQAAQSAACAPGRTCVSPTCKDKTIYSQCWAAGCSGTQVCCPTTLTCPSP